MDGQSQPRWAFGQFEVDLESGELRRAGLHLALHGKPIEVLAALLAEPGRVVTRERLRRELWSDDLYGDIDHRLNNAVNRLRTALGDSASNPRFVETIPRRGYRFIAPIRALGAAASSPVARPRNHSPATAATAAAAILLVAVGAIAALRLESPGVTVEQSAQPQVEYLKGRHLWAKKEPEAVLRSRDYFLAAIEHDPSDGLAWTGLADAYNFMGGIGLMPRGEAYERATQAAETALDQDAGLGEAYASLAEARFRLGPDDEEVEPLFRRARQLAPDYAMGRYWYGMYLSAYGRQQEALAEVHRAHQLAPLNLRIQVDLGAVFWLAGDKEAGRRLIEEALTLDDRSQKIHLSVGWLEWREDHLERAAAAFRRAVELSPEVGLHRARLDELAAAQGPIDEIHVAAWRDLALESVRCQRSFEEAATALPVG